MQPEVLAPLPPSLTFLSRGSSFALAGRFLTPQARRGMAVLYAFCRVVDDIADSGSPRSLALRRLKAWDAFLSGKAARQGGLPDWKDEVAWFCGRFDVPAPLLKELVQGARSDLRAKVRFPRYTDLLVYCHRVAGVVGQACLPLFGISRLKGREFAETLGRALQLINIVRDARQDGEAGRIYVAREDLRAFGVSEAAWLRGRPGAAGQAVLEEYGRRARVELARALGLARAFPRASVRPAMMMADVYGRLLERMASGDFRVFETRFRVPAWERVWLVIRRLFSQG